MNLCSSNECRDSQTDENNNLGRRALFRLENWQKDQFLRFLGLDR
ncbi:hypothetical protein NNRS527_03180 (plasmid) [Nitrosospira sp. NRS527]|nr:hypothetical protein NNRS527_03180 [Nitrosospira sp. NRS527]